MNLIIGYITKRAVEDCQIWRILLSLGQSFLCR